MRDTSKGAASPAVISVVIPTKDRPDLLRRCLRAVLEQRCEVNVEVLVVNDAGCPLEAVARAEDGVILLEGPGHGPASARNVGIAHASGEIVVFTDDDTIPQPGWLAAATRALGSASDAVGVVGKVVAPRFDPLYEHSVMSGHGVGNFLTCNAAYRRDALIATGGFDIGFPYPAAEDRDLGYRMQQMGPVIFEPTMVVEHPARAIRAAEVIRRGRLVESDWRLFAKHPHSRTPRWSTRWGPLVRSVRHWQRLLTEERVVGRSPRRAGRFALLAAGQVLVALWTTLRRGWLPLTPPLEVPERRSPSGLKVAWIGATPEPGAGVAGCAWLILQGLSDLGCQVDCFVSGADGRTSAEVLPGVRMIGFDTGWRYDRWYSRHRVTKTLTGLASRAWGRRHEVSLLLEQQPHVDYDVIYQFSTIEVFGLRRHIGRLAPVVIHPGTHMAGELRWVRIERPLAARCEPWWRRVIVDGLLSFRAARQRRDIQLAQRVIAISRTFADHLIADYGLDPSRVTVVANPIDLDELSVTRAGPREPGPWRLAFVGRISARKGVDLMVELSHRLADLAGDVTLDLVGGDTLWSDYRPLLDELDTRVARYRGAMSRHQLIEFLDRADLLIHPAKYEPFGLTVGEALAKGVPVVVSDQVGAGEEVSDACCRVVPFGDIDALESAVREMVLRLSRGQGPEMSRMARSEAERLFDPKAVAGGVLAVLREACAEKRLSTLTVPVDSGTANA